MTPTKGTEMNISETIRSNISDNGEQLIRLGELLKRDANSINVTNLNKAAALTHHAGLNLENIATLMMNHNL